MDRIFLVDDDGELRSMTASVLGDHGYDPLEGTEAMPIDEVVDVAARADLVLLDLTLEHRSGIGVLTAIRDASAVPVVIVSARADEVDRVLGLRLGADDFLPKPFGMRELVARVGAVLRRCRRDGEEAGGLRTCAIGGLTIDLRRRVVTMRGATVHTTHHEFEVLRQLARSPGEAVPRDLLLRKVWRTDATWGVGVDASLTEHVRRLRQKLEADPHHPELIETVRGVGYRLAEQVR